jgi:FAD/FMN-containing dehydrogenase
MDHEIYDRLAAIVGSKWISDEPEIVKSYSRELSTYARFSRERAPQCVVLPSSTDEVRNIFAFAKLRKVPLTVYGTGLNIGSGTIPKLGGIILDSRRMDKILEIDEEHCTATVEPGVSLARLSSEMQKRGMFIAIPGAPASAAVISNYTQGEFNKAMGRLGAQGHQIVSTTNVLSDGTVVRTGSFADAFEGGRFWPHGPGPDLGMLMKSTLGTIGMVTELTVKAFPLDDHMKPFWLSFEDINAGVTAMTEICHRELCTGSCFYIGNKYHYFGDTVECGERLCKIHPNVQLILTLQGTERRVEYEEKTVRKLAKKYGGVIVTDTLPFYQMYVDSHLTMAASLYSEYTMRYFGSPGSGFVFFPTTSLDNLVPTYDSFVRTLLEDPYFRDPEGGSSDLYTGLIGYPSKLGAHYFELEPCTGGMVIDPEFGHAIMRVIPKLNKVWADLGVVRDMKLVNIRKYEIGYMSTYENMIRKIKNRIDPEGVFHPGQITPPLYR